MTKLPIALSPLKLKGNTVSPTYDINALILRKSSVIRSACNSLYPRGRGCGNKLCWISAVGIKQTLLDHVNISNNKTEHLIPDPACGTHIRDF